MLRAGIGRMLRTEQSEHIVSRYLRLLNGWHPLAEDSRTPGIFVAGFNYIASRVDVRIAGAHTAIHFDAAPTSDASGTNEINQWLDTDSDQYQFAGDALATAGYYRADLPISSHNLPHLFAQAHVDTVAPLLLQHHVRGNRIKHLRPQHPPAQQVRHFIPAMAQRLGAFQRQRATANHYDAVDLRQAP